MRIAFALLCLLAASCTDSTPSTAPVDSPTAESPPVESPAGAPEPVDPPAVEAPTAEASTEATTGPAAPTMLEVEILSQTPHDPAAFTQGLVLDGDVLFESTGRDTSLRRVERNTGDVLAVVDIDDSFFGEGLELVGDRLIQLTWRNGVAFVYDVDTFEQIDQLGYDTEGWGLCLLDERTLAMSDGSSRLTFRDPETFTEIGSVNVTLDGQPVTRLNELECVGSTVWANVWQTNTIVGIDAASGDVTAVVDAQELADIEQATDANQVLNGIAHDPVGDTFLLTGKEWSTMFEVRFVEAG